VLLSKKEGLSLVQQLITLSNDNSAASVQPRAGTPLDAEGADKGLDLSDPAQRSQFLAQLMTPGTSGSYATSNSYQQFGKAVNYAVSLSYSPLQPSSGNNYFY